MIKIKPKKFDLITVGGATRDILFYSKEGELIPTGKATKQRLLAFEYGAKIYADRIFMEFGGGAANSAVSASRLGLKTAVFCRLGQDQNGQEVLANFKKNNVDTSLIKIDPKHQTGFSVILTINNEAKEHIAFLHRGANDNLCAPDIDLQRASADWFYVTALPTLGWQEIMEKLIKSGKNIAWNPGAKQLENLSALKKFLPKIKILMVNEDEAREFKKLKDIKGLLSYIFSLGPRLVIITAGRNGAYAYDGKKYYYMKAASVKPVNTLGVGDAFGSALTSALICGKNIKEALRWGIINSAAVVNAIGAQKGLLNRRQIKKI